MTTTFATIDALRESLAGPVRTLRSPEYVAKMMHPVPEAEVVDRAGFVLDRCRGRRVLELGASGPLHAALTTVAAALVGIDRTGDGATVLEFDLDAVASPPRPLPTNGVEPDVIVAGEVLEHLSNPGHLLDRLRAQFPAVPVVVTVPNAFTDVGRHHLADGIENVNRDHVAWYSWRTVKTLVERAGYRIAEFRWAGPGRPGFAEGLIFVLEPGANS